LQGNLTKSHRNKYLILALLTIVGIWSTGYLLGQKAATLTSDFLYIPLTIFLSMTAIFQARQAYIERKNVFMWTIFFIFSISFLVAQHIFSLDEIILDEKPFPSLADAAFIIGTICLVPFFILFVKSLKVSIPKWTIVVAILSSCGVTAIATYFFILAGDLEPSLDNIVSLAYPILDSISLAPAVIGMILYFRNKLSVYVPIICLSMISTSIGDLLFQFTGINGTDYSGSISDLFFYIQYILLTFGVYSIANPKIQRTSVTI